MRNLYRALLAGSLGFAVAFVAGCGGGAGLLSGDQANTLQNQLNKVSSALSAGRCNEVRGEVQTLANQVQSLPATVNGNLRQALDAETGQVSTLSVQQCHVLITTPAATTPTTTARTTTTTTTTQHTTTTPTTTTPTTPTTTTPATTTTPPGTTSTSSGGGGLSGGSGGAAGAGVINNGNGNGNGQ